MCRYVGRSPLLRCIVRFCSRSVQISRKIVTPSGGNGDSPAPDLVLRVHPGVEPVERAVEPVGDVAGRFLAAAATWAYAFPEVAVEVFEQVGAQRDAVLGELGTQLGGAAEQLAPGGAVGV